jgi:hypothetical protein
MGKLKPLWTCPSCKRKFVTRNLWHSCVRRSESDFLKGKSPHAVALYRKFKALVKSCGPILVVPVKTRIAFMVRVRFCGVWRMDVNGIVASFWITRRLRSRRFLRVECYGPESYGYYMRIRSPRELDSELLRWLKEAYRVGKQEHLQERAARRAR